MMSFVLGASGILLAFAAGIVCDRLLKRAALRIAVEQSVAAKPRVRVLPGGWIRHAPGPCPVPARTVINTADEHGLNESPRFASEVPHEWWEHKSAQFGRDVLAYRIVREAQS